MIPAVAVAAEFETLDGLRIEVTVQATDEQGLADVAVAEVIEGIQRYIDLNDKHANVGDLFDEGFA